MTKKDATSTTPKKRIAASKDNDRAQEILAQARALLIEEGYAGFSARKLAQRVGISLSNVQYYFPSKVALVQALFEATISTRVDLGKIERVRSVEQMRAFMIETLHYFLARHQEREHQVFLRELWALAAHDAAIAEVMNSFYHQWVDLIAQQLRVINPDLPLEQAERRALLIISLVDGLSLFHGAVGLAHRANQGIEADLLKTLLQLIG